jgi:hypothetical protein
MPKGGVAGRPSGCCPQNWGEANYYYIIIIIIIADMSCLSDNSEYIRYKYVLYVGHFTYIAFIMLNNVLYVHTSILFI